MESKKTLAELTNNQQTWTEEDIEDVKKITESITELKRAFEPYSIEKRNINNDNIYLKYYKEYTIISSIFESFIYNDFISLKDLLQTTHDNSTNSLFYKLSTFDIKSALKKMIRLGYITTTNVENKYNPIFSITDVGIECNRQQTIQNLAATTFTNYQTFRLSKRAEKMNIFMLFITIISLIVAVCSVYVTINVSN